MCLGPVIYPSKEPAVELSITYQYKDPEGHMMIDTMTKTWSGQQLLSLMKSDKTTDQSITEIEVLRVKEGSSVEFLSNNALRTTSGVKTDANGRKYIEKTCINGYVYRDYEGHAITGNRGLLTRPYVFTAD